MASPQRHYQHDPEAEPASPPQSRLHPAPAAVQPSRKGWRSSFSLILLFAAILIWYVGFGWGDSGGWLWGNRESAAEPVNNGQISGPGVAILEVADKQDYAGQPFEVRNVPVDHWSGKTAVWIGSSHSYLPMLLLLPPGSGIAPPSGTAPRTAPASPGSSPASPSAPLQRLDVTGKVVKAPPLREAQQQWHLSDEDVDQLEQEGVYIQATQAQLAGH